MNINISRTALVIFTAALLTTLASGGAFGCDVRQSAPAPDLRSGEPSISADPNVRVGCLPNGMGYAIMRPSGSQGQISIRLRI